MVEKMSYKIFADYGKGKDLDNFVIYFNPKRHEFDKRIYELLEREWENIVEQARKKGKTLYNESLLNFDDVKDCNDITLIKTSPVEFREYVATRNLLDQQEKYDKKITKQLENKINPLSSFPAVLLDDYFIMGIKGKQVEKGSGALSFPGAGYLSVEKDTIEIEGNRIAKHPSSIVKREIKEELNISSDEIKNIKAIAIAKDCYKGSHWNTAIFSFVETDLTEDDIKRKWNIAQDTWEHEKLIFVPKENKYIESILSGEIPYSMRNKIKGKIPEKVSLTGKAKLMLKYFANIF